MTAEEKQFLEAGELGAYVQNLYDTGSTTVIVTQTHNKSWYLIQHD